VSSTTTSNDREDLVIINKSIKYKRDGNGDPYVWSEINTFGIQIVSRTVITSNDKDSRPRPADLLASLTARVEQSTFEVSAQVQEKTTEGEWNPANTAKVDSIDYEYILPPVPGSIPEPVGLSTKHRLKIRSLSDDYSSDLAEVNKSADGFVDAVDTVATIWKAVKGKSRRKLSVCDVASASLAVNFGIKPVLASVERSMEAIVRKHQSHVLTKNTRGSTSGQVTAGGAIWNVDLGVRYTSYIGVNTSASGNTNYGSPLEWAWELIPYSFVVDYMFNVGDSIAALGALRGLQHKGTCTTYKKVCALVEVPADSDIWTIKSKAVGTFSSNSRGYSLDLPSPEPPRLDISNSLHSLRNAGAVLVGLQDGCKNQRSNPGWR